MRVPIYGKLALDTFECHLRSKMTDRQAKILQAVVEQYAEVASPVGSSLLARVFDVSSATIRADMAELERLGYI